MMTAIEAINAELQIKHDHAETVTDAVRDWLRMRGMTKDDLIDVADRNGMPKKVWELVEREIYGQ